jgi:predicted ATP-binding protein involved in virulence
MELVYLWVEEYKNIKNQGFNFSPRFKCEFDGENLTITENKDYMSIFPDNINITAIVGENGSGKTSFIDFINTSIHIKNKNKFLFLFLDNNQKYYTSNLGLSKINLTLLERFNFNRHDNPSKNIIINSKTYDMHSTLKFFISIFKKVEKNLFFNPSSILIKENEKKKLEIIYKLLEDIKDEKYLQKELLKINIYTLDLLNKFFNNGNYIEILCNQDEYDVDIPEFYDEDKEKRLITKLKKEKFYKDFLLYLINLIIALKNNSKKPDNPFGKHIQNKEVNYLFRNDNDIHTIEDFFHELVRSKFIYFSDDEQYESTKDTTFQKNCTDYFDLEKNIIDKKVDLSKIKIEKIEKFKDLFYFDFFDNKDVSFNSFSEGEKNLFLSNLEIYSKYLAENKIILLDEIELFLHPQWQKQYINRLLKLFDFNNLHFIFVTHSPFLLSDIPKENVIFLEKYDEKNKEELEKKYPKLKIHGLENGNCINVTEHIELKTFGANIHTLLANGFFMSDGLMGEFAKSKINEIKKFYEIVKFLEPKNKKYKRILKILYLFKIKEFKHIQSIIGEPFLQTIIKNYLDELEILFNGKKEFLDKEILRLQELRKDLK